MVLFPNIAPYDSLGAVATMGSRHFVPMTEITAERIAKAFRLAMEFFREVDGHGVRQAAHTGAQLIGLHSLVLHFPIIV